MFLPQQTTVFEWYIEYFINYCPIFFVIHSEYIIKKHFSQYVARLKGYLRLKHFRIAWLLARHQMIKPTAKPSHSSFPHDVQKTCSVSSLRSGLWMLDITELEQQERKKSGARCVPDFFTPPATGKNRHCVSLSSFAVGQQSDFWQSQNRKLSLRTKKDISIKLRHQMIKPTAKPSLSGLRGKHATVSAKREY